MDKSKAFVIVSHELVKKISSEILCLWFKGKNSNN